MKDNASAFALIAVCFAALCVLVSTIWGLSERNERDRFFNKCLTEHEALPHKDAVVLCRERVK